jgi:hypothetical protein
MRHEPPKLTAVLHSDDRRVRRGAGRDEVLRRQPTCVEGQDADPLAWWQQPFDKGDLHQGRSGDRYPPMRSQFVLVNRQETAGRGQPIGAFGRQFAAGFQKCLEQPGG